MEGIKLPNQEKFRMLREKEILRNIRSKHHQTRGDEIKEIKKEYRRIMRKLLKTKVYCRNIIKVINTWAIPLVRYTETFLKWTKEEL